jgi:hypothetical protein
LFNQVNQEILMTYETISGDKPAKRVRLPRIVKVTTPTGVRFVRAINKSSALQHVVEMTHTVDWATPEDVLANPDVKVETAGDAQ